MLTFSVYEADGDLKEYLYKQNEIEFHFRLTVIRNCIFEFRVYKKKKVLSSFLFLTQIISLHTHSSKKEKKKKSNPKHRHITWPSPSSKLPLTG